MLWQVKESLINHCAPVIMKYKPAALFRLPHEDCAFCLSSVIQSPIKVQILYKNKCGILVLVYNSDLIENIKLTVPAISILQKLGYPKNCRADTLINHFKKRFRNYKVFPHEIGFFLGYPQKDVLGFIENCGLGYTHCGLWKVYGDALESQKLFECYADCSRRFREYIEKGLDIKRICADIKLAA
jgi:hypothetical protein